MQVMDLCEVMMIFYLLILIFSFACLYANNLGRMVSGSPSRLPWLSTPLDDVCCCPANRVILSDSSTAPHPQTGTAGWEVLPEELAPKTSGSCSGLALYPACPRPLHTAP